MPAFSLARRLSKSAAGMARKQIAGADSFSERLRAGTQHDHGVDNEVSKRAHHRRLQAERTKRENYKTFMEQQREAARKKREEQKAQEEQKRMEQFAAIETTLTAQVTFTMTRSLAPELRPLAELPLPPEHKVEKPLVDRANIPPGPGKYELPCDVRVQHSVLS